MDRRGRGLRRRHVAFLTIGGTIGGGMFLGVGQGIQAAGPAMIVAFLLTGAAVSVVARGLAEMATAAGGHATFVRTTRLNLGRRTAFVEGWSYWACAVLTCMAELAGAGALTRAWLPAIPSWIVALPILLFLAGLNRLEVRRFGEIEFWMALLKIVACLVVIGLGLWSVARPAASGTRIGIGHLWSDGGVLPRGWRGLLLALPVAVFASGGSELVGLATADADEPVHAARGLLLRITAIYVGVTTALLVVMPWRSVPTANSPFVMFLSHFGLHAAVPVMAIVLLSAVLSSCNSCLYGATRVLASLAEEGLAPARLGRRNRRGAPAPAVTMSSCFVLVAVALELLAPARLFALLLTASAMTGLANWGIFIMAHLRLVRRTVRPAAAGTPRFWPWPDCAVLLLIALTFGVMAADPEVRPALLDVAALFGMLTLAAFVLVTPDRARPAGRETVSAPSGT